VRRALRNALKPIAGALPMQSACRLLYRRRDAEIPISLCVDIEPDDRLVDRDDPQRWHGFERLVPRIEALRERLSRTTGEPVPLTWLLRMDPQVAETWGSPTWAADTYRDVLAELESRGDEFGLHTHLWRWDPDAGEWFTDLDPAWGRRCVTMGLEAFETAFGRSCAVHRGGDHALDGEMLACLTEAGVEVDLTVEPGLPPIGPPYENERIKGRPPDYRGLPRGPYRSSPSRFPAPDPSVDGTGPLLVPQASGPPLRGLWGSQLAITTHPSLFAPRILAELRRGPPPVLVFTLRTDPVFIGVWRTIAKNLEHLARHPGARFVTASAVARSSAFASPRSASY